MFGFLTCEKTSGNTTFFLQARFVLSIMYLYHGSGDRTYRLERLIIRPPEIESFNQDLSAVHDIDASLRLAETLSDKVVALVEAV